MEASDISKPGITIGVPKETLEGETRVALIPDDVAKLIESGVRVLVQKDAGGPAFYWDETYRTAGADIAETVSEVYERSDVVVSVRPPRDVSDLSAVRRGTILIGFLDPARSLNLIEDLDRRGITAFAMEAVPRVTRAQSMDALSSMSTIAGYRAALLAAEASKRMFPMLITAAGTQPPSRVLVLGAGVAGLQALATAKRLGAITEGFDTRPEVREQVQSVGAAFVEMPQELVVEGTEGGYAKEVGKDFLEREQDAIRPRVSAVDAVITTALIPGKPAPVLITEEMVKEMKPGSVVVDLAAEQGGNCELSKAGETVVAHGVTILGPINIPAQSATQASQMYSRNIANLVRLMIKDGHVSLDFDDEIIRGACVTPLPKDVETQEPTPDLAAASPSN
jgi:NAD(P) transhydrogenase subunit alpha